MVEKTTQIVHTFCGTPGTNGEGAAVPKGGMGVGLSFQQAVSSAVNNSLRAERQAAKTKCLSDSTNPYHQLLYANVFIYSKI